MSAPEYSNAAFVKEADDYDSWFNANKNVFESELQCVAKLVTDPATTVSIGLGSGLFDQRLGIGFGCEPAEGMAELARKRGIHVRIGPAEKIPFEDGKFDGVLMNTILSYVNDRQAAVAEAWRVLKPGGHLVVSYLPREGTYGMLYDLAYLRGSYDPQTAPPAPYPIKFLEGVDWCSTPGIIELLTAQGFTDLEFMQTLTTHPIYSNDAVESPIPGYDRGDFIACRAVKPTLS